MQAFFTQVGFKPGPTGESIRASGNPTTKHPRTGDLIFAHALETGMPDAQPEGDRRQVLAEWMTGPGNRFFARNIANRTWAHLLGRGLVEPIDDVRLTNPPSNPELLDALADHRGKALVHLRLDGCARVTWEVKIALVKRCLKLRGHLRARHTLARHYYKGVGVKQDRAKAA